MLDLQEKALDQVAFAVEREVTMNLWRCCSGWDHGDSALLGDGVAERFCIVTFVAQNMLGGQVGDQCLRLGDVADLPGRQDEPQGIAYGIDNGMDFRGQAAARPADRASFRPPFLPAAC